jgi:hypothetical protein
MTDEKRVFSICSCLPRNSNAPSEAMTEAGEISETRSTASRRWRRIVAVCVSPSLCILYVLALGTEDDWRPGASTGRILWEHFLSIAPVSYLLSAAAGLVILLAGRVCRPLRSGWAIVPSFAVVSVLIVLLVGWTNENRLAAGLLMGLSAIPVAVAYCFIAGTPWSAKST